jgi:hypothetical protein
VQRNSNILLRPPDPEDEGSVILRNGENCSPKDTALFPSRLFIFSSITVRKSNLATKNTCWRNTLRMRSYVCVKLQISQYRLTRDYPGLSHRGRYAPSVVGKSKSLKASLLSRAGTATYTDLRAFLHKKRRILTPRNVLVRQPIVRFTI